MTYQEEEEQPLDPVMERVRKKMIRLMVISIGIMMVGLMAVLFAIVYKISNGSSEEDQVVSSENAQIIAENNLELPEGSTIVWKALNADRLVLEIRHSEGANEFVIVDTGTGKTVSRIKSR